MTNPTTTIGSFRDVIDGASSVPSFRSLGHDFPDDSGTITDAQRDNVADAYAAAIDRVLSEHGITRWGDELIGEAGKDYDLDAVREDTGDVDFWAIVEQYTSPYGDLHDYETGEYLRPASDHEMKASLDAAGSDGGAGAIEVDGRVCYVVGEEQYDDSGTATAAAPALLRQRLAQLGLSQQELARQLDVDPRTVRRWVAGDTPVPASVMDEVNGLVARASQDAHELARQIRETGTLAIGHPPEGVPSEAWWDRICIRALATLADVKIV